jgi:XrtJ-associated TM-motif-TM protein
MAKLKVEVVMKLKTTMFVCVLCAMATAAHAQGGTVTSGCGSSPENPTVLLALVGSASGLLVAARNRFRK